MTQSAAAATAISLITKTLFAPSPMQVEILNWIVDGRGSAIIEAVAGAGAAPSSRGGYGIGPAVLSSRNEFIRYAPLAPYAPLAAPVAPVAPLS